MSSVRRRGAELCFLSAQLAPGALGLIGIRVRARDSELTQSEDLSTHQAKGLGMSFDFLKNIEAAYCHPQVAGPLKILCGAEVLIGVR